MNWELLKPSTFRFISEATQYDGKNTKTGELYQKVSKLSCSLEDKVKFILQHWGWNGVTREESKVIITKINQTGFTIPINVEQFFEQMCGLHFPRKTQNTTNSYGGTLEFWYQDIVDYKDFFIPSECLSVKFDDDIMPIGYMLEYDGYSSNAPSGWEDPYYKAQGCCCSELFLGSSGKVYLWNLEVSDYIGVEAENLLSFFAVSFGLIKDQGEIGDTATDEDIELMEKIENYYKQGIYKQNCFRTGRE